MVTFSDTSIFVRISSACQHAEGVHCHCDVIESNAKIPLECATKHFQWTQIQSQRNAARQQDSVGTGSIAFVENEHLEQLKIVPPRQGG